MSDLEKIKQLRQSTGAGFKDCSAALNESGGDLDKAVEILRVKGISKASKKMSREAKEGVIAISGDSAKISILEVNCETDFVAKNDDFINFVKELSEINNEVNSDLKKLVNSKMKNEKNVEENLVSMIAKIGEKITLGRSKTVQHSNSKNYYYLNKKSDLKQSAKNLYSLLRKIKKDGYNMIAVEKIPNEGIGKTINDRLLRASKF